MGGLLSLLIWGVVLFAILGGSLGSTSGLFGNLLGAFGL